MSVGLGAREAREVCGELGRFIRAAWERGWQPADLHRYARRNWDTLTVQVVGDAMAADVARHSPSTVDQRWHAQLEEMEASVWWEASTDHLTARAAVAREGWAGVLRAVHLLRLSALVPWPTLERLGPVPGEAAPRRTSGADLDHKLLTKVRMMLAKAESTPYEEEAEAFTAAAQKLMSRHSIDRAMLDDAERQAGRVGGPAAIRVGIERPYEDAKFSLLAAIALANRCRAVWHKGMGFATVVGFEVDLRAVELLHASLLVQATAALQAAGSRASRDGSGTRTYRRSFLTGFAHRIGERLAETTREETATAASKWPAGQLRRGAEGTRSADATTSATTTGRELVRVLAQREAAVEDAVGERFPQLRSMRSRASLDYDGWQSGRAAAERAQLGARGRLA